MENQTRVGMNRTGAQMSPRGTQEMEKIAAAESAAMTPLADTLEVNSEIASMRLAYINEADRIGSVPLPGTVKGVVSTTAQKLSGKSPEVFIDKLGERLAFERSGTRLYDAMIGKCQGSPMVPLAELRHIRDEEARHFKLLKEAIVKLGADPTAQTPCADAAAVASMGIMQVLTDPRTSVPQCLNALLTAELTDNAGWELLIKLAEEAGQGDMAAQFRTALQNETDHVLKVKTWLETTVLND